MNDEPQLTESAPVTPWIVWVVLGTFALFFASNAAFAGYLASAIALRCLAPPEFLPIWVEWGAMGTCAALSLGLWARMALRADDWFMRTMLYWGWPVIVLGHLRQGIIDGDWLRGLAEPALLLALPFGIAAAVGALIAIICAVEWCRSQCFRLCFPRRYRSMAEAIVNGTHEDEGFGPPCPNRWVRSW